MPYDPSGNFTRDYDWTTDRNNGVKVRADRMDGEFNNFATAMNQVLLRNGVAPWTGNANMGGNSIVALADGTVGTPAIRFLGSPTTGVYSPGMDRVALTASGSNRIEANATGVVINGVFHTLGDVGIGTATPLARLHVQGATTVTGQADVAGVFGNGATGNVLLGSVGGTVPYIGAQGASAFAFYSGGTERARFDANGNFGVGASAPFSTAGYGGITLNGATGSVFSFGAAGLERSRIAADASGMSIGSIAADPVFFKTGNIERARIDTAGNFGVGASVLVNTAGYGGFTLSGTSGATFSLMVNGLERSRISTDASGLSLYTLSATPVVFGANNAERMRIDPNGNVGIGTAAPTNYPGFSTVSANGLSGGRYVGLVNGSVAGQIAVTGSGMYVSAETGYPLYLQSNSVPRVVVTAAGEALFFASQAPTSDKALGYLGIPQSGGAAKTSNYTCVLADAGQHVLLNGVSLSVSIPANASVPYPVGTTLTFVNRNASLVGIGINGGDTLIWADSVLTGVRTLRQNCAATAVKIAPSEWLINGTGLA